MTDDRLICAAVRLMIMPLLLIMLAACSPAEPVAKLPGPETYAREPVGEDNFAVPVPVGAASTLTAPLVQAGAFCAQTRSNEDARAIWCRNSNPDDPWVAQFLLDQEDRLAFAWFPEPPPPDDPADDATNLATIVEASLGALWPDQWTTRDEEFQNHEIELWKLQERGWGTEVVPVVTWADRHADYTLSSGRGLVVAGRAGTVSRWPAGADHYGGLFTEARPDLEVAGFECYGGPLPSCRREFHDFAMSVQGDRIVTAAFFIAGDETLSEVFPRGLTFLTPAVRTEVAAQIERSHQASEDFLGIVAGTLVIVDAAPVPRVGGPVPIEVRVGAPLTGTHPI